MKVREREYRDGGMGGGGWWARVYTLPAGSEMPANAETVSDDTPEHDWQAEGH